MELVSTIKLWRETVGAPKSIYFGLLAQSQSQPLFEASNYTALHYTSINASIDFLGT